MQILLANAKIMFEVTKDKAQQFKVLSSLMKDKRVTELVCATDAGREGELIFRLVYNKAGCTKPFKRLWISSLEDSAIREGFQHLRDGKDYDRLYEAALSRSKADWIVGINGTRLFTTLYHKKLVVGRVQTPTLAMLVERDGKISTFQKEKYFNVHVGKGDLTADLEKVKTEEEAKRIAAACEKKQAVVSSLKRETKTVNRRSRYVSTGINIPADDWDFDTQTLKTQNPAVQLRIYERIEKYSKRIERLEALEVLAQRSATCRKPTAGGFIA